MQVQLTELQKTQAAYAYFTLEEWKMIAEGIRKLRPVNTSFHLKEINNILVKLPSAAL